MATKQVTATHQRFNKFWVGTDAVDFDLALVVEDADGTVREWVDVDLRELPCRPDLLSRMSERGRRVLLARAECAAAVTPPTNDSREA